MFFIRNINIYIIPSIVCLFNVFFIELTIYRVTSTEHYHTVYISIA